MKTRHKPVKFFKAVFTDGLETLSSGGGSMQKVGRLKCAASSGNYVESMAKSMTTA